jgi:hypothetical protein
MQNMMKAMNKKGGIKKNFANLMGGSGM